MTKVHPNGSTAAAAATGVVESRTLSSSSSSGDGEAVLVPVPVPVMLTVWKKSLLFNCDGFTVFDSRGNLVFRVDNYMSGGSKAEIVLMDASGKSLLTIRRKRLSLSDKWLVFQGETTENPVYSVTKHINLLNTISNTKSVLAHVNSILYDKMMMMMKKEKQKKEEEVMYEIRGSYAQRCCSIYDSKRRQVGEIKRKEGVGGIVFGVDVFKLVITNPLQIQLPHAMAFVILLDQMFGSSSSSSSSSPRRPHYFIRSLSSLP